MLINNLENQRIVFNWHIYMPQIPVAMGMGKRMLIPKNLAYMNFSLRQSSEFQPN